jgi:NDP-sugar pyrophosphorylase family protein
VLNGDLVTEANFAKMMTFHETGGYVATLGIRQYGHQVPFGCVTVEGTRVRAIEEKPVLERTVNAGMYILNPALLSRVPRSEFPITALFEDCLAKKEPIGAFEIQEDWIDVGQRDQLRQAQQGQSS